MYPIQNTRMLLVKEVIISNVSWRIRDVIYTFPTATEITNQIKATR